MLKRKKYDFELLKKYCSENNVVLLEDYSCKYVTRNINIKCKCAYENCNNEFEKNFRQLEKTGAYCGVCKNIIKLEKSKSTCLEKYGVENSAQNKEIHDKNKKTCLEKYGVEHSFQSELVKNKIKNVCLEKYGFENAMKNKEVKQKAKKSCLGKYGVEYSSQSKENREKFKITCLEKYGVENPSQNKNIKNKKMETSLKNWGVEYPIQNLLIKNKRINTCINKWGVEYPIQNEEVMSKNIKQNYRKKEYTFPSNKIIEIQGYENFALDELIIDEKIDESYIITGCKNVPIIWYNDENGKKHRHYVDIFIPSQNRCIEVKSTWTAKQNEHNIFLKQSAAKELGYKYSIWVYNNKKEKVNCYD
jgi:hypothetical protein